MAQVKKEMQDEIKSLKAQIQDQKTLINSLNEDLQKEREMRSSNGPNTQSQRQLKPVMKSMDLANGAQIGRMPAKVARGMGGNQGAASPRGSPREQPSLNGSANQSRTSLASGMNRGASKNKSFVPVRNSRGSPDMREKAQLAPARSPTRPTTARPPKMNIAESRSPGKKSFKPSFDVPSAEHDVVDPIYENKDPIATSVKQRMEQGSVMSLIKPKDKVAPFFYTLTLVGPGLTLDDDVGSPDRKDKGEKVRKADGSPRKEKKQPDPISKSI